MEANELRIGNITKQGIVKNFYERGVHVGFGKCYGFNDLEPIPLTEEWLKRFGYVIIETNKCVEAFRENFRYSIQQVENSEHWFWCDGQTVITNLKHVHQLQNLYFALTNEELTLKQ